MPEPAAEKGALAEGSRRMPPRPGRFLVGSLPESSSWDFLIFIYLCLVVLGVRCWMQAFSHFLEWGLLSTCCAWLPLGSTGSRHTGLAASWHVGSSGTGNRNCVPCLGRCIPLHCTTGEVLQLGLMSASSPVTYLRARFPFWFLHHQGHPLFLFPKYLLN